MANRQLVEYVRTQLVQRASIDQIRTILLQQGWMPADVEAAIMEAHQQTHRSNTKEHHAHFLITSISIIIILGLIFGLLVVVFKKSMKEPLIGEEEPISVEKTLPPVEEQEDPDWYVCRELGDYATKHACYYDLNFADNTYNCDGINDAAEKNACYRGKDQVLLDQYAQEDNPLVEVELE